MISLTVFISLALLPLVTAQSNDTTLELNAIKAHFTQSQIVPSLLASFDPNALLTVNFAGLGDITPGQAVTKDQSSTTPTVTVTPANSSTSLTGAFTIAMVDADIVGSDLSKGVNHHWLVNGVEITDNKVSLASATAITAYAGPGPASGSGPHRYVFILYKQPASFTAPPDLSKPTGVALFNLQAYVEGTGLELLASTYMTVEVGTATVSIPVTSSVISSTLASAPSGTKTGSPTGTTGTTGAVGPTNTNSAFKLGNFSPLCVIIAGLMIMIVT